MENWEEAEHVRKSILYISPILGKGYFIDILTAVVLLILLIKVLGKWTN